MPVKTGSQVRFRSTFKDRLDSGFRRNDGKSRGLFNPKSAIENLKWDCWAVAERLASDALAFVVEVVDDDVVAHLIGRRVKDPPGI
jgi:hypothetical protein